MYLIIAEDQLTGLFIVLVGQYYSLEACTVLGIKRVVEPSA